MATPSVRHVADRWFWMEKQSLNIFYGVDRPIPAPLREAIKAFDAGWRKGESKRNEDARKKND